jgi:anaerobic selenocysteine-containing dehydrogenase
MRRVGPKGAGQFERMTWDEALAEIAERFKAIMGEHGAEAILPYSFAGTMGVVNIASMDQRLFNKLGASRLARTVCSIAGKVGYSYTMGDVIGTDPEQTAKSRYIIAWGANVVSANMHQMAYIRKAQRAGAKFIHIDVHRNRTTAFANEFVHIRPGTDAALALGMMHVIVAEALEDRQFIDSYTIGFDRLVERLGEYPPDRVERITGVPADTVRRLAREYATMAPAFIRIGNGLQHHDNGGMAVRTIACLPALVGAWRHPAGGALKSNSGSAATNDRARTRPDLLDGRAPRTVNMNQLGDALTRLDSPPVKALFVYNANPAVIAPDQVQVLRGLERDDLFTVVHEQLMTDTARYADILLPATTHLEHADLYTSYWHLHVAFAEPVIAPLGEAKPNVELFSLLAKALGFEDTCFDDDVYEISRQSLDNPANPRLAGITLDELRRESAIRLAVDASKPVFDLANFPTPSGKIEFYSESMARVGLDPLPAHTPLVEGGDGESEPAGPYALMFVTPPNHFFLNSTYSNMPSSIRSESRPTLEIHPVDAERRNIQCGERVRVFNDRGWVRLTAKVTDAVKQGVVVSCGLWWGRDSEAGLGVNATTPQRLADMGGGATFFSNLVEVEPVAAPAATR